MLLKSCNVVTATLPQVTRENSWGLRGGIKELLISSLGKEPALETTRCHIGDSRFLCCHPVKLLGGSAPSFICLFFSSLVSLTCPPPALLHRTCRIGTYRDCLAVAQLRSSLVPQPHSHRAWRYCNPLPICIKKLRGEALQPALTCFDFPWLFCLHSTSPPGSPSTSP